MTKRKYDAPCIKLFVLPMGQTLLRSLSGSGSFNDFTDGISFTGGEVEEEEDVVSPSIPPSQGGGSHPIWGD